MQDHELYDGMYDGGQRDGTFVLEEPPPHSAAEERQQAQPSLSAQPPPKPQVEPGPSRPLARAPPEQDAAPPEAASSAPPEAGGIASGTDECIARIAAVLGISGAAPAALLAAVQDLVGEAERLREQLQQQRRENLALHIQVANNASDTLELRQQVFEQECLAEPSIVQLKTLLCDPAVAREFNTLRDEALRLQKEVQVAKDQLQALNFNPEAKRGRLLMNKLKSISRENEVLGARLKTVAKLEAQAAMLGEFAGNMQSAYSCLDTHVAALDAEAEDMTTHIASLQKAHATNACTAPLQQGVLQSEGQVLACLAAFDANAKDMTRTEGRSLQNARVLLHTSTRVFQFNRGYHEGRMRPGDMSDRPPHLRGPYTRPDGRRFAAGDQPPLMPGRPFLDRPDRGPRGPLPPDSRYPKRPFDGPPGPYPRAEGGGGYNPRDGGNRYPQRDLRRRMN